MYRKWCLLFGSSPKLGLFHFSVLNEQGTLLIFLSSRILKIRQIVCEHSEGRCFQFESITHICVLKDRKSEDNCIFLFSRYVIKHQCVLQKRKTMGLHMVCNNIVKEETRILDFTNLWQHIRVLHIRECPWLEWKHGSCHPWGLPWLNQNRIVSDWSPAFTTIWKSSVHTSAIYGALSNVLETSTTYCI